MKKDIIKVVVAVIILIILGLLFYFSKPTVWAQNARIDIKATTTLPDKQLKLFMGENEVPRADWNSGIDTYAIHERNSTVHFSIKPIVDSNATVLLRGPWETYKDGTQMKLWVKYTSLKINGEEILKKPQTVWHDEPFTYSFDVKKGTTYNIEAVWDKK